MNALERKWAEAVISGFTLGTPGTAAREVPPFDGVDYAGALNSLIEHGNPVAALGARLALVTVATAPLWHWGERRTVVDLSGEERVRLLKELVEHSNFAVRELATLMKIQASMAMFRNPAMRTWAGYGRDASKVRLSTWSARGAA